jgi:hypothetical protein
MDQGAQRRDKWTRLSYRIFDANAVRPLDYNFTRTLAMPKVAEPWSLASLQEADQDRRKGRLSHGRYITFQLAEMAVSRQIFDILMLVARLQAPPAPASGANGIKCAKRRRRAVP